MDKPLSAQQTSSDTPDAVLDSRETEVPTVCSVSVKEIQVRSWTKQSVSSYSLHPLARGAQTPVSVLTRVVEGGLRTMLT